MAAIGLGSNLGDREGTVDRAVVLLACFPGVRVVAVSSLYRTAPWGDTDQPFFLNACVLVETGIGPRALLAACLDIERRLGRTRSGRRWGPRVADLDLLYYGDAQIADPELRLPHPAMPWRGFVLAPLAELVPGRRIGDGLAVSGALARLGTEGIMRVRDPFSGVASARQRE